MPSIMSQLDYTRIADHYAERVAVHRDLVRAFKAKRADDFAALALGISSPIGNYSASEHGLGPKVLSRVQPARVLDLAHELIARDPMHVPRVVWDANIWQLKISVGSEIAAMVEPRRFWVTNTRTVWAHLLVKHNDNVKKANDEVQAYRDNDPQYTSEMQYAIWSDIHLKLDTALTRLAEAGAEHAKQQLVKAGDLSYLWADAVANALYEFRDHLL
ncbi:MAG: hypothetical protein IT439_03120 [Phycisphaerales bacterium]|nr:hypothetical protein [Phycisphaerales bacterium]